jgi:hypothetical protein
VEINKPVDAVKALVANYQRNHANKTVQSDGNSSTIASAILLAGAAVCEAIIYHADTTKAKDAT